MFNEQNSPEFLLCGYGWVGLFSGKVNDIVTGSWNKDGYIGTDQFHVKYPEGRFSRNLRILAHGVTRESRSKSND